MICEPGDDEQHGSSVVCDVSVLQALSRRVHLGKFVAESKFQVSKGGGWVVGVCCPSASVGALLERALRPALQREGAVRLCVRCPHGGR